MKITGTQLAEEQNLFMAVQHKAPSVPPKFHRFHPDLSGRSACGAISSTRDIVLDAVDEPTPDRICRACDRTWELATDGS